MYLNGTEKMIVYTVVKSGHPFLEPGDEVYRCLYGEVVRIRDSKVRSMLFFNGAEDVEVQ